MAKKQLYDSKYFDTFGAKGLAGEAKSSFGFLIGTKLQDGRRDVIFAAGTPPQPDDEGKISEVTALLQSTSSGRPYTQWASQHAVQLKGLLPGGLELCGVFCVGAESPAMAAQLVPVLKGISEPLVLLIEPSSKKWTFKQHDSKGSKPAFRPAQLKASTYDQSLLLSCALPIDLVVPREKDIANSIHSKVMASLASAVVCFEGDGSALSLIAGQESVALSKIVQAGTRDLNIKFLTNGSALRANASACAEPCTRVRCMILARALVVHRDWEVQEVMAMVRESISSSLQARISLAIEEAGDDAGALQLPWQALCRPIDTGLPIWCGDLCMPDEQVDAACERLASFLGLPDSEALEVAPARLDESQMLKRYAGTYDSGDTSRSNKGDSAGNGNMLMMLTSATVVLAMIILAVLIGTFRK